MQRERPEDLSQAMAAPGAAARGILLAVLLSSVLWVGLAVTLCMLW
ncbi:hypothetical protein ACFQS7_10730 [Dankookia sp. GCM10030260]